MSSAVEHPAPSGMRPVENLWDRRTRLLARSASHAALVLPSIVAADFVITGPPGELSVTATCQVARQEDLPDAARQVTDRILVDLEGLLAIRFSERIVNFTVAEPSAPAAAGPEHRMTVVSTSDDDEASGPPPRAELQTAS